MPRLSRARTARPAFGLAAAGIAGLLGLAACSGPPPGPPPPVLLVTIDTLRPDRIGCGGDPDARTPRLDALARRGTQFAEARVPYPLTLPSHATLLTGQLPYRHGARRNDSFALDRDLPTMASVLGAGGARATGAIVSTFVLNRSFGLAEPFGTYLDFSVEQDMARGKIERRADEVTDLARAWLTDRPDSSFFLWTHYFDPHDDYTPPPPLDALGDGSDPARYGGEIAFTDFELGRLLHRLDGRADADRLVLVVTSDHGEAFGEHGETGHGFFLYETTVRVPLIVARGTPWAARAAGATGRLVTTPVRSLDVFPTVCRLVGAKVPAGLPGRDLDPFGDGPAAAEPLYLETFEPTVAYGATDLRGIVDGGWKRIAAPRSELYDLAADPRELDDADGAEPDVEARLDAILAEHRAAERAAGRGAGADSAVDEATRARLLALGYLTAGAGEEAATGWSRRDPKDIVHLLPRMFEGVKLCRQGKLDAGLPILESVLAEDPVNAKALHWVAEARQRKGDAKGAVAVWRRAVEHDPANPALLNNLGLAHLRAKEGTEAVAVLETAVEVDPQHVGAWLNLASAYGQTGRPDEARAAVQRALVVDPRNPLALRLARRLGIPRDATGPASP